MDYTNISDSSYPGNNSNSNSTTNASPSEYGDNNTPEIDLPKKSNAAGTFPEEMPSRSHPKKK